MSAWVIVRSQTIRGLKIGKDKLTGRNMEEVPDGSVKIGNGMIDLK